MEVPNKKTKLLASFCWVQCYGSKRLQSNVRVCKQKRAIINLQNAPGILYPKSYRPRPRAHAAPLGVLPHPPIRSVTECTDQESRTATTPKKKSLKSKIIKSARMLADNRITARKKSKSNSIFFPKPHDEGESK